VELELIFGVKLFWISTIDPKNSNFQNRKIRCQIIRFKLIFYDCDFFAIFSQILVKIDFIIARKERM